MKKSISLLILIWLAIISSLFAQKLPKAPSNIGNALVLEFAAPFDRILIDTDEPVLADRENVFVLVGTNAKILDEKGKSFPREAIRAGMKAEIKLEPSFDLTNLIATQIKVKTNPENEAVAIKGFLDKVADEEAFIDGKTVILIPNATVVADDGRKKTKFSSFKDIQLGSILELKGTRREDGKIYAAQGQVRPNLITPAEKQLIQLVQKGLVLPPPGNPGAGVTIGKQTFKVVDNLELNTYITKVGYKIIPRYLKNLQDGDPNKILFRFYVLDDDTPNAVALPDGSVFINTGLLRKLDNEAQLAFILGHEIAHVSVEHPRRTLEAAQKQAFWMGLAAAAAGATLGQEYGRLIGQIGFGLLSNKFARDMEDQADRIGLFYAYDAGYDNRESAKIWRKLIGDDYRNNTVGTFLYSDHPSLKSRLRNTKRELLTTYQKADYREVVDGRAKYMETVGVFFGWVKPKPKVVLQTPKVEPKAPVNKTTPKVKPKTQQKKSTVRKKRP
jgi:hypothetical protein